MPRRTKTAKAYTAALMILALAAPGLFACAVADQFCKNMEINSQPLPDGAVGKEYEYQMSVNSNCDWFYYERQTIIEFDVVEGEFPPGLLMGSRGSIWGAPTTEGEYRFTVEARHKIRGIYKKKEYTIIIYQTW